MPELLKYEFTFRECFAEFFGLLSVVYFGGWLLILYENEKLHFPELSLGVALIYCVLSWSGSSFSKTQFNPAITLACLIGRKMTVFNALVCFISQLIGSYLGAILIYYTIPEILYSVAKEKGYELGCPHLNNSNNAYQGMFIEFFITFIVTLAYFFCHD